MAVFIEGAVIVMAFGFIAILVITLRHVTQTRDGSRGKFVEIRKIIIQLNSIFMSSYNLIIKYVLLVAIYKEKARKTKISLQFGYEREL